MTALVLVDMLVSFGQAADVLEAETIAVAGVLAGYCGSTRRSYATDLRLFSASCHEANLTLFDVRRTHLELYGRWMDEAATGGSNVGTAGREAR